MLKAKIRQVQRQMAQNRMMEEVPNADVVITNPTHVAVALRYDPSTNAAPVCVAKGYDLIAQRIKKIAAENDIPQVENVPLARALAKAVEVGREVPVDFYQSVAEVLSAIFRMQDRMPECVIAFGPSADRVNCRSSGRGSAASSTRKGLRRYR